MESIYDVGINQLAALEAEVPNTRWYSTYRGVNEKDDPCWVQLKRE
jgi:hypothetical protein